MRGMNLCSWRLFSDVKDAAGRSLLHHVISQVHAADRYILKFVDDFPTLDKAAR